MPDHPITTIDSTRTDQNGDRPDSPATEDLKELAVRINDAHALCKSALSAYAEYAVQAGELLLQAKAAVGHGQWLAWVEAHCTFSQRTAQVYTQLARKTRTSYQSKAQRAAHICASIRRALENITTDPKRSSSRGRYYASSGDRPITLGDLFYADPPRWKPLPGMARRAPEGVSRLQEIDQQLVEMDRRYTEQRQSLLEEYTATFWAMYKAKYGVI